MLLTLSMMDLLALFFIGLISSFLGGLIGLGGGFLVVPLVTLGLHFNIKDAIFFSLASILLMSIIKNIKNKKMIGKHRKKIGSLAIFTFAGSIISAMIGVRTPPQVLQIIFACLLIFMSILYFFDQIKVPLKSFSSHSIRWAQTFLFLGGSLSGLLGVGGGIINVPVLNRLLKFEMRDATRFSFTFVFISVATALVVILNQRREELYEITPIYLIVMLVGTFSGANLSEKIKISSKNIRKVFCFVLFFLGIFKLLKAI